MLSAGRPCDLSRSISTEIQSPRAPRASNSGRARLLARTATLSQPVAPGVQALVGKVRGSDEARQKILELISGVKGRGKSGLAADALDSLQEAVRVLEDRGGLEAPTNSALLEGRWRLLFTTRPGSASPIQRSFTGVDAFTVYQEILLQSPSSGARVNNIVDFGGKIGQLKVEAEANTIFRPLPGFTPRKGRGLPLLGKSESTPPSSPDVRIDFQFDRAAFDLAALPFKIPYPVPFKLLGDETKGWLDITYLSPDGQFRLSRGNKGTLFVLVRDPSPREQLLQAIERGQNVDIEQTLERLQEKGSPISRPAKSAQVFGRWRLRWSKQAGNANPLQRLGGSSGRSWQTIRPDGTAENRSLVIPGLLTLLADATCQVASPDRTTITISIVYVQIGPFRLPFKIPRSDDRPPGYVDWLYLDETLRVTRGSRGSLFVHTRDELE